jgi:hypothetical protein
LTKVVDKGDLLAGELRGTAASHQEQRELQNQPQINDAKSSDGKGTDDGNSRTNIRRIDETIIGETMSSSKRARRS